MEDHYNPQVEIEKLRTKQKLYDTIFWLGFWFLFIGGCTVCEIWGY